MVIKRIAALMLLAPLLYALSVPASAQITVPMEYFCNHLHQWAGSNTTYPQSGCTTPRGILTVGTYCEHLHRFALNNTTFPTDDTSVFLCKTERDEEPVPRYLFCTHVHQNAGTTTTYPHVALAKGTDEEKAKAAEFCIPREPEGSAIGR